MTTRTYSFVVRIWREEREVEGGEPVWRGQVDYVQGGERFYFHRLEQLVAFLKEVMDDGMTIGEGERGQAGADAGHGD